MTSFRIKRLVRALAAILIFAAFGACASNSSAVKKTEEVVATPLPPSLPEQYGPLAPSGLETPAPVYGPDPVQIRPITLVLGPGMAEGFAHVGAIRALVENKIPIRAIYGMELGSLVASLYALDSNINYFEWGLYRLNDDVFLAKSNLIGRIFSGSSEELSGNPEKLESALKQVFGAKTIADAKTPLRIEIQRKQAESPSILDQGALVPLLRVSLAGPGFFGPGTYDGQPAEAASDAGAEIFLVGEARAQSGAPVVLIDTATTASDPSAADLVIRPSLKGIGPTDFLKKTEIALAGKKAVEEHLPELRKWVGLPQSSGTTESP